MRSLNRSTAALLACGALIAGAAQAQTGLLNNAATARTSQAPVGVAVGTGTTQGQSVVDVSPSSGRPPIGIGVGSGKVDHFGSKGSVSVANNARLLGVDGAGGPNSANSVSVRNPTQRPVLAGAAQSVPQ